MMSFTVMFVIALVIALLIAAGLAVGGILAFKQNKLLGIILLVVAGLVILCPVVLYALVLLSASTM